MKKNEKLLYRVLMIGTGIIVILGILLPGMILYLQGGMLNQQVTAVPAEYYSVSSSAMARSTSANLSVNDKIQLVSGKWSSSIVEARTYEMDLEEYEAVQLARTGVEELYKEKLYPENLADNYKNWYTWEANSYKAIDSTFHTYTAYYWRIQFEKYDKSARHTVYVLEDGTVFFAKMDAKGGVDVREMEDANSVLAEGRLAVRYFQEQEEKDSEVKVTIENLNLTGKEIGGYLPYFEADLAHLEWMSTMEMTIEEDSCVVLQGYSSSQYVFAISS